MKNNLFHIGSGTNQELPSSRLKVIEGNLISSNSKQKITPTKKIAIIGSGVSAQGVLNQILIQARKGAIQNIEISIFEKRDALYTGLAYNDKTNSIEHNVNMEISNMSFYGDFLKWLKENKEIVINSIITKSKQDPISNKLIEKIISEIHNIVATSHPKFTFYSPRFIFGMYLDLKYKICQTVYRNGSLAFAYLLEKAQDLIHEPEYSTLKTLHLTHIAPAPLQSIQYLLSENNINLTVSKSSSLNTLQRPRYDMTIDATGQDLDLEKNQLLYECRKNGLISNRIDTNDPNFFIAGVNKETTGIVNRSYFEGMKVGSEICANKSAKNCTKPWIAYVNEKNTDFPKISPKL